MRRRLREKSSSEELIDYKLDALIQALKEHKADVNDKIESLEELLHDFHQENKAQLSHHEEIHREDHERTLDAERETRDRLGSIEGTLQHSMSPKQMTEKITTLENHIKFMRMAITGVIGFVLTVLAVMAGWAQAAAQFFSGGRNNP